MEINIRTAKTEDAKILEELDNKANKEKRLWKPRSKREFVIRINQNKRLIFVAEVEGDIVGYLQGTFRFEKEALWIEYIYVKKGFRRKGITKILIKKFINIWKNKGIVLITSNENKNIFEKLGFKKTANYMIFKRQRNFQGFRGD